MIKEKGLESLDDMIKKNGEEVNEEEEQSLNDIPNVENTEYKNIVESSEQGKDIIGAVSLTNLSNWFTKHVDALNHTSGVRGVRPDIKGVDPNKNLIITVLNEDKKEREVWSFRKANELPVLDLEPAKMRVFENNTFEIDYDYNDLLIKTYNLKNKLIIVPSHVSRNLVIPYSKFKVKFDNSEVQIPGFDKELIDRILNQTPDTDFVKVKYPQIKKVKDELNTNFDVFNYLNKRQNEVYDMNHIIQLDDVISEIVNNG